MLRPNDFDEAALTSGLRSGGSLTRLPSRPRVVAVGLASIAGIIALVAGVPYLLVRFVRNPLPAGIPTWEQFSWSVTNGQIPDRFWIGMLAAIAWFAWMQLVLSLMLELVAVVRSTELPTIPTFGLAQGLASQLVGAVLMLAVVFTTVPVDAVAMGLSEELRKPEVGSVVDDSDIARSASTLASEADATVRVQVQRRQTLRSLAEDHYGDPERWVEIRDRNVGSVMPDGATLSPGFTRIKAGWNLEVADSRQSFTIGTWTVAPGDHFWLIASSTLAEAYGRSPEASEVHAYWLEIIETNRDAIKSGSADLIYPGESFDLTLPPVPSEITGATDRLATTTPFPLSTAGGATSGSDHKPAEDPAAPAAEDLAAQAEDDDLEPVRTGRYPIETVDDVETNIGPFVGALGGATASGAAAALAVPSEANGSSQAAEPAQFQTSPDPSADSGTGIDPAGHGVARVVAAASGLGFLAAGFVRALRRRRAMQWARRVEGRIPAQPVSQATRLKNDLASTATDDRADFADSTLRAIWSSASADPDVAISHVEVGDDQLNLHSAGAAQALAGCAAEEDGSGWLIGRDRAVELIASGRTHGTSALPLLLCVGRDPETGEDLLLNLGHSLTVDLRGSLHSREQFLSTAALELATSRFADDLQVLCCGFGSEIEGLQRVQVLESVGAAIAVVRDDPFSVLDVTASAPSETTSNYVILVAVEPSTEELDGLLQLALSGIASIAPGIASQWSIALSPGKLEVGPIGRTVERTDLTVDQFAAMGQLVATSALTEYITADRLDAPESEPGGPELACDIELRVLGRVEVAGADRDFESARALDVVTYLAFYRDGADADQLRTWIWPIDEPPTDKAFANVMTRARKGLGLDDEGEPYLSRAGSDGVYRLAKSVATDFDRFQAHIEYAQQLGDPEALEQLTEAMRLVRGVPFTGGGATGYLWADLGVRSQVEFAIDEAAHRCADTALALGDATTARWAAFRGLSIIPGCEQCYRRRFLAAAVDKNRAELATAMAELQKLAAADMGEPESSDAISPELVELYEELMRHPARSDARQPARRPS